MDTSWEPVNKWYSKITSTKGHYYHKNVIFPKLLRILEPKIQNPKVMDLGCSHGVLSHVIPKSFEYVGLDASKSFIEEAKELQKRDNCKFIKQDVCKPFDLDEKDFSHAFFILSLQNMDWPKAALKNVKSHLRSDGTLVLVLNHPCFRAPKQTSWEIDRRRKIQYRRVDRYLSHRRVPIIMHPGQEDSPVTYSFHHSIESISKLLSDAGFAINNIYEWCSDKTSEGGAAKMENYARSEFPLFMTIVAKLA